MGRTLGRTDAWGGRRRFRSTISNVTAIGRLPFFTNVFTRLIMASPTVYSGNLSPLMASIRDPQGISSKTHASALGLTSATMIWYKDWFFFFLFPLFLFISSAGSRSRGAARNLNPIDALLNCLILTIRTTRRDGSSKSSSLESEELVVGGGMDRDEEV